MKKILSETPELTKFIEYSLPVFIIGIISRTFPVISFLYYLVPVFLVVYIIFGLLVLPHTGIKLKILIIVFAFPVYSLISSFWSLYPVITLERSLYLILMYAGILSVVFLYKKYFSQKGIDYFIPANILVLIISLVSLILNIPENRWTGGNGLGFMGFAGHQNTLASAVLFTLPGIVALSIGLGVKRKANGVNTEHKNQNKQRTTIYLPPIFNILIFWLLLIANFLLIIATYSRASVLSLAVGVLTFLIITKSKKNLTAVFALTAVILVLYFTNQQINHSLNQWLNKDGGDILGRRMILWKPSVEAAKLGGVFGLGYGVSAPNIKTPELTGSHYEDGRYIREKGNSTLAVIEETGLVGLASFLLPLFFIVGRKTKDDRRKRQSLKSRLQVAAYLPATLAALLIHAQFEAWWVGPGSIQLPIYLIILFMLLYSLDSYTSRLKMG